MSAQRARSAVSADHRSAHPNIPGIPWWGAVLLAATATAVGFAFDAGSGNRELSMAFSVCYALGCVAAVLAVRRAALFTAVIQPPLILFAAVPSSYYLFHSGQLSGVKDLLINCGYPLIERFPLMFFTSATVLIIGMARRYFGASPASRRAGSESGTEARSGGGLMSSVTSKMSSLVGLDADEPAPEPEKRTRRKPAAERTARTARTERPRGERTARTRADRGQRTGADAREAREARAARKPTKRTTPPRQRPARAPETEIIDPVTERPRRPRPQRRTEPASGAEPRRRPRPQADRERRLPPLDERGQERPRRRRLDDYELREPRGNNGSVGTNGTHHPVSRVRYRNTDDGEDRVEYRTRRPRHARWDPDA